MKKITLIAISGIFILSVMFMATGCKKKGASKGLNDAKAVATPIPTPAPTPIPANYSQEINEATEMQNDYEKLPALKDIFFDYDQYSLTQDARDALADDAIYLKRNKSATVQIEGHCDERGTVEYNLALGQKRAQATKDYLVSMGIDSSRLSTISYGEEQPLNPGHNEAAWAQNRRAHLNIVSR